MDNNYQRKGSKSNAHVGKKFEETAKKFFQTLGITLSSNFGLQIGVSDLIREHKFDLGSQNPPILVECKSHRWTGTDNVPSAKITTWNQEMYYFSMVHENYRRILFVLKDFSAKRGETLAKYYIRTRSHLIPTGVEIWEFDEAAQTASRLK